MKTRIILTTVMFILTTFMVAGASTSKVKDLQMASYLENVTEPELTIETWMVNDFYWNCMKYNCLGRDWDNALTLEPWMTDVSRWELNTMISSENEAGLHMEPWMTDENVWKGEEIMITDGQNGKLMLEYWMTGKECRKQK